MFAKVVITVGSLFLLHRGVALAQDSCPPDCPVKGGGSPASDCLIEFGGINPIEPGSRVVECTDGDPTCDQDPTPGVCGFEVTACLNNADPSLPTCTASGVDRVRVRGGGEGGRDLQDAIEELLPTNENVCSSPVTVEVPLVTSGGPAPGRRRFSLSNKSFFSINALTLGTFSGFVDLEAGPVDPTTGLAVVNAVDSSPYLSANLQLGGLALCIRPVTPTQNAGVMVCGQRKGGRAMRVVAGGPGGSDRDGLLLRCNGDVNYTTSLTVDSYLGEVGVDDFTAEQCTALRGTVDDSGVCDGSFVAGQLPDKSGARGEMVMAPFAGLTGFPVEIIQERALPCGDEGTGGGMSAAIALTTMRSAGRVLNPGDILGAEPIEQDITGEPFDCDNFTQENGPGILVFAAPQLGLPILGDGVTKFRFVDN